MLHFRQIAVKHISQQRLFKLQSPQPAKMFLGPVIAIGEDITVTGKKFEQLVTYPF